MASDKNTDEVDEANDPIVPLHVGHHTQNLVTKDLDPNINPRRLPLGRQDLQLILRPFFNTPKRQFKYFTYKNVTSFTAIFKYYKPFNFEHYGPRRFNNKDKNKRLRIFVAIIVDDVKSIFCHQATYPSNIFTYHNNDTQDYYGNVYSFHYISWQHSIKSVPKRTRLNSLTFSDLYDKPLIKAAIDNGFKIVYTNDNDGHEVTVLDPQKLRDSELKEKGDLL